MEPCARLPSASTPSRRTRCSSRGCGARRSGCSSSSRSCSPSASSASESGSAAAGSTELWSNPGGSASGGPSVGDAQDKIEDGDRAAYKELAEAYRAEGKQEEAIAAGEAYVRAKPTDYAFMRTLASDYEGKAARQRDEATLIQEELSTSTGTTFAIPPESPLGRALGTGQIDRELTADANQKLTELYGGIESAYYTRHRALPARRESREGRRPPADAAGAVGLPGRGRTGRDHGLPAGPASSLPAARTARQATRPRSHRSARRPFRALPRLVRLRLWWEGP